MGFADLKDTLSSSEIKSDAAHEGEGNSAESSSLKHSSGEGNGGVPVTQSARDLDVHENMLRKWVLEAAVEPQQAFAGRSV
ncbi:hypothetical protein [Variovorax sp. IB41]|uniref:hypothetical protein n=1 Tax=Variovorax sp. IB41 TaxID=2779370 RepID=UPI0018E8073C|nr:hypothetical protein [Variovorax sp. IB41]MBJ2160267.1 hypothetical protein [Variovorax sp. IB41]